MAKTKVLTVALKQGVSRSLEFEKKFLATHSVNCGLLCGHDCAYCSTPSLVRTHPFFKEVGQTAYTPGLATVDPDTPVRIASSAKKLRPTDTVMLCTITDAWEPNAQIYDLGRRCLEALLTQSDCQIRILTKNAAVVRDFDLIEKYRDRVMVGLSITGPPSKTDLVKSIEPNASDIPERISALREAHAKGLRTYGMLCPCLPGIADDEESLEAMAKIAIESGAEKIWLEPVNPRGRALVNTEECFVKGGKTEIAEQIHRIRKRREWSRYARNLIENAIAVGQRMEFLERLHILLYPSGLEGSDLAALRKLPAIVWLK